MNRGIEEIKKELERFSPDKIILFGSRARGDDKENSDYDIMLIFNSALDRSQKLSIAAGARRTLAAKLIDADILVKSNSEFESARYETGSISKQASAEGIVL